jgi:geranylgeranyl reductase family protein
MTEHFDIIIVGGGPAGSACGTLFARAGLQVLLLEKTKFPREKICGACVNPRAWQYFEHLGVADELRSHSPNRIDSFRVTDTLGRSFAGQIPSTEQHPFFSLSRARLDAILLQQAKNSGAVVLEETAVVDIRRNGHWEVVARQHDRLETYKCEILVGADGRNSIVARKTPEFSLSSSGVRIRESDDRVGVQWHAAHQLQFDRSVQLFLFDSGYAGFVNLDSRTANIALVTSAQTARLAKDDFEDFLEQTLGRNPVTRELFKTLQPVGEIHMAATITPRTQQSSHADAFLIGDSRQTVEPFTGEGILFALQDAWIAARTILARYNSNGLPHIRPYNRFIANRFLSTALRHPLLAQQLTGIGSTFPFVARPLLRSLFSKSHHKEV